MALSTDKPKDFDDALAQNIPEFYGVNPLNSGIWLKLLCDMSVSLYEWHGLLNQNELLKIENYIFRKKKFVLVRTKYKLGSLRIKGALKVLECVPLKYDADGDVSKVRIITQKPVKDLVYTYTSKDFVYFKDKTLTVPYSLALKYSEIMGKLDALYEQNINKLSIPLIAITQKTLKNQFIELFRRAKLNALYTLFNANRGTTEKTDNMFYNPQIDFLLDKIVDQRHAMMDEYMEQIGVEPKSYSETTQYVNSASVFKSSLVSKYFGAILNKYRDDFCLRVNSKFDIDLRYNTTVREVIA